ncbi:MAG: flagellin-like protein [Myxococcota bacterium]
MKSVSEVHHSERAKTVRGRFRVGIVTTLLLVAMTLSAASPAFADRYDKRQAGHPLRIAAYFVYPIGALIDIMIMRPGHWLISHEPFKSAVGHQD